MFFCGQWSGRLLEILTREAQEQKYVLERKLWWLRRMDWRVKLMVARRSVAGFFTHEVVQDTVRALNLPERSTSIKQGLGARLGDLVALGDGRGHGRPPVSEVAD